MIGFIFQQTGKIVNTDVVLFSISEQMDQFSQIHHLQMDFLLCPSFSNVKQFCIIY